jgi:predicted MPP superfamily phosphohydrolase
LCEGYLCCRKENGFPSQASLQAGKWGAYQCDLPSKTVTSALEHIRDFAQPDFMFWTGDNSPHDTYETTEQEVTDMSKSITEMIKTTFGEEPIQIFPCLGNHDTWPID